MATLKCRWLVTAEFGLTFAEVALPATAGRAGRNLQVNEVPRSTPSKTFSSNEPLMPDPPLCGSLKVMLTEKASSPCGANTTRGST